MTILEHCSICDMPLDADNCYGEDEYPLCRDHHGKFYELLEFMLKKSPEKAIKKPKQLSLIAWKESSNG